MRIPKLLVDRCSKRFRRRTRSAESLEPRSLLDSAGLVWNQRPYLTASFAPDGTDVNGQASELSATLASLGDETAWQATILRAFQTWAVETNADVGIVADSGDPFGSPRFNCPTTGAPSRPTLAANGASEVATRAALRRGMPAAASRSM